ncbi:alpha/beta hydrolase [Jatrophihabitans endophyticus]|uniref:alpha/beta fold hydrolase n=1 Tax=Jatrophihabitans endophyticus TaxID=1206085 RepID=UPI0019E18A2A|nr:alpha/beta hydrolase [Jatrophihabitans endophyticus]MBE7189214.1 alpha/beta hydrolase [Jatrophihabitans endophyticus]
MTAPLRLQGFEYRQVDVDGVRINTAVAGEGPPVLLLHGYPENHLMWRGVAPGLTDTHTVVVTDLRGYGDSDKPAPAADGATYAKRAMAADQVGVMRELGHDTFAVVGHDRGARVAHRLALDHAEAVTRLAVLDIVPTRHVFGHADRAMATAYFHWFFLATGDGIPEHLIAGDPEFWLRAMMSRLGPDLTVDPEVLDDYVRTFAAPGGVEATCSDYHAGATADLEHDDADADAGRQVACPTLVLWGERGFVGRAYDPLDVWRQYAPDVRGHALPCGHFLPEEQPAATLAALRGFVG